MQKKKTKSEVGSEENYHHGNATQFYHKASLKVTETKVYMAHIPKNLKPKCSSNIMFLTMCAQERKGART